MRDSRSYPAEGLPEGRKGRDAKVLAGVPKAGAGRSVDEVERRGCVRYHASFGASQVALPLADLKRIEAGFTAETDEAKFDHLLSEVEPIAETLVDLMNLDDLQ